MIQQSTITNKLQTIKTGSSKFFSWHHFLLFSNWAFNLDQEEILKAIIPELLPSKLSKSEALERIER